MFYVDEMSLILNGLKYKERKQVVPQTYPGTNEPEKPVDKAADPKQAQQAQSALGGTGPMIPFFDLKILNFTKNEDIENKQSLIDYAHHVHTLDKTIKRT